MKVSIDKSKCAICGTCVALCPEVFEITPEGIVDIKAEYQGVDITDEELQNKVREAAGACPSTAVVIEE
jgi:ferredoxin